MPKDAERGKTGGTPFRKEKQVMDTIFDSLQQTANRLNATADSANELVREANERLGTIGAGVAFASDKCVLREEPVSEYNEKKGRMEDAGHYSSVLSYAKIHGTWQLAVERRRFRPGSSGFEQDYDLVGAEDEPLLNADREIRIEAASMLPEFLQEYTARLEGLADRLKRQGQ